MQKNGSKELLSAVMQASHLQDKEWHIFAKISGISRISPSTTAILATRCIGSVINYAFHMVHRKNPNTRDLAIGVAKVWYHLISIAQRTLHQKCSSHPSWSVQVRLESISVFESLSQFIWSSVLK